ncbi:MAG TPA: MFS transporter [Blastocatellia bacterium]|nr:MFS transporter [Blastocatellia bacterium]
MTNNDKQGETQREEGTRREDRAKETRRRGDAETRRGEPVPASLFSGLSRSTIILGIVSLLSDISTEMVYPLLPIFLTETLKAPATAVGLIEGIAVGTASVVTGISGWISDRLGRRKAVALAGYVLTAVSKPMIAFAGGWPVVLGARFAERFGKGIRSAPKDAMLAESTDEIHRGRAYGFERAMDYTGAVLGPLIAIALVGGFATRTIFMFSFVPASIAALLILSLRERRGDVAAGVNSLRLSLAGTTREYRRLMVIVAVFGLANSANAFLILRAQQWGLETRWTILAYAMYNAVAAIGSLPAGAASDRFGRRNLLIAGFAVYAIAYVGFAAGSQAWMVWPLFALYGLFPALTDGVAKAMAVDTAGSAGTATAIGVYSTVLGVTQVVASYVGGMLWDKVDASATFYFGAGLSGAAVVLLFALLPARTVR